jgi:hypothetical protein
MGKGRTSGGLVMTPKRKRRWKRRWKRNVLSWIGNDVLQLQVLEPEVYL